MMRNERCAFYSHSQEFSTLSTAESHALHSAEVPGWLIQFDGSPLVVLRPVQVTHPVTKMERRRSVFNAFIQYWSKIHQNYNVVHPCSCMFLYCFFGSCCFFWGVDIQTTLKKLNKASFSTSTRPNLPISSAKLPASRTQTFKLSSSIKSTKNLTLRL